MLVKDIMTKSVKTIEPDSTIQEAADTMSKSSVGSLIVVRKGELMGILTERDILTKVVAKSTAGSKVHVKDIMTKEVVMIEPDTDIEDAAEIMVKKQIKKLPVVHNNQLIGIVTSMDIVSAQPKMIQQMGQLLLFPRKKKAVAG